MFNYQKAFYFILFILICSKESLCQARIGFNDSGLGDIRLNKPIAELKMVIPLDSSFLKDSFSAHPGSKFYYVYNGESDLNYSANLQLIHCIISISATNRINRIILFMNDKESISDSVIGKIDGRWGWSALSELPGKSAYRNSSRITNAGTIISISKSEDQYVFPVGSNCKIEFMTRMDADVLDNYSLFYRNKNRFGAN